MLWNNRRCLQLANCHVLIWVSLQCSGLRCAECLPKTYSRWTGKRTKLFNILIYSEILIHMDIRWAILSVDSEKARNARNLFMVVAWPENESIFFSGISLLINNLMVNVWRGNGHFLHSLIDKNNRKKQIMTVAWVEYVQREGIACIVCESVCKERKMYKINTKHITKSSKLAWRVYFGMNEEKSLFENIKEFYHKNSLNL